MANSQKQKSAIKYLKAGTLNAQTLNIGKSSELIKTARRYDIDIIALQETHWPNDDVPFSSLSTDNYTMYCGGTTTRDLGTGFLINKRISQAVIDMQFINDWLSYIVLKGHFYKEVLIGV